MIKTLSHIFILFVILASCKAYKQDIMFRLDDDFSESDLAKSINQVEQNYKLQPDDIIQVDVFTNNGERLVDPNSELGDQANTQIAEFKDQYQYLIQSDGSVKLPMIGKKVLSGLSIDEAESLLEQAYSDPYYVDTFVKLKVLNRRVIVLGGEGGQVIPIENENTTLVEVLAIYGGLNISSKAENVRLIRGNLNKPQVYYIDLSSIAGMQQTIIDVESGDIIYVEPWRRPWLESLRDMSPVFGLITSVTTLLIVLTRG